MVWRPIKGCTFVEHLNDMITFNGYTKDPHYNGGGFLLYYVKFGFPPAGNRIF